LFKQYFVAQSVIRIKSTAVNKTLRHRMRENSHVFPQNRRYGIIRKKSSKKLQLFSKKVLTKGF